jgi:hypothetical protein
MCFLGYSSFHKGYKCLDMDSGCVYISRDVIFDENIFSFQKTTSQSPAAHSSNLHALQMGNNSVNMDCSCVQIAVLANPVPAENPAATSQQSTSKNPLQQGSAPRHVSSPSTWESPPRTAGDSPTQHCTTDPTTTGYVPDQGDLSPDSAGPTKGSATSALPPVSD